MRRFHRTLACVLTSVVTLGLVATLAHAQALVATPKLSTRELAKPLPQPYDAKADAKADVAAAFVRAQKSGKRVLIDVGANWCPDCRVLAGAIELPEFKAFVAEHFEVALIDVGRFDRNMGLAKSLAQADIKGIPTVLVYSPDGKLKNGKTQSQLDTASSLGPQAILDIIAGWAE